MKKVEVWKCDYCDALRPHKDAMAGHEKLCRVRKEEETARVRAYVERENNDIQKAVDLAEKDKALRVLLNAGLKDEALERVKSIADNAFYNEYCGSHWYEDLYSKMLDVAKKRIAEDNA